MSAARNQRLAWISQEIAKGKSNATIVLECMAKFPGTSEHVARKDLKELLQRLTEIELENLPEIKTRFLEIGWKLLEECRSLAQMGPAVNQFKALAIMSGVLNEKGVDTSGAATGSPESEVVRNRIKELMKNKKIKQEAKDAGIDLDELTHD